MASFQSKIGSVGENATSEGAVQTLPVLHDSYCASILRMSITLHTVIQNWQMLYVAQCDMNTEVFVCQVTCTESGPHGTPNDVQRIVAAVYTSYQISTTSKAGCVCLVTKSSPNNGYNVVGLGERLPLIVYAPGCIKNATLAWQQICSHVR